MVEAVCLLFLSLACVVAFAGLAVVIWFLYEDIKESKPAKKRTPADQEEILAIACELCKYPADYKDPDDLWAAVCDECPLLRHLEEQND